MVQSTKLCTNREKQTADKGNKITNSNIFTFILGGKFFRGQKKNVSSLILRVSKPNRNNVLNPITL